MAGLPKVGPWAKQKLAALERYLDYYTKVLKNQRWRTIYVDAFAGAGAAQIRTAADKAGKDSPSDQIALIELDEQREIINGSPLVALEIANSFSRYVFVDPKSDRVEQLTAIAERYCDTRQIDVRQEPAADAIAWLVSQSISKRTHRGVAFLDPFGTQLSWADIEKLANTGLFEVVVNFALGMAIQRMLPNNGEVLESSVAKLTAYFGTEAWRQAVYRQPDGGLFAAEGVEKYPDYQERLLDLYRQRLEAAFGYVSTARLIKSTRGVPLYYLVWAGPNPAGLKGADYVLQMGDLLGPPRKRRTRGPAA